MDTITITGNITAPEQRTLPGGGTVTTFRIASGQRRFNKESEKWEDSVTNWYTVSAFRALGEHAYMSLHRGERVIVTGRLRLRDWETPTKRGTSVEIDADALGHDLLWGTSVFRKFEQRAGSEESWAPSGAGTDGEPTDASWAAPGVESDAGAPVVPESDEDAKRRLDELLPEDDRSPEGDRALALVGRGEETPF